MKARTVRETILLYRLDEDAPKGRQLRKSAENMGIRTLTITQGALREKLGALADGQNTAETGGYSGPAPQDELMIFCGFSRSSLDRFLSRCRTDGIGAVALKAVLTEHNRDWDVLRLLSELKKEHELFTIYQRLHQLMQTAEQIKEKEEQTAALLVQCRAALERKEPNIKELEDLTERLEKLTVRKRSVSG